MAKKYTYIVGIDEAGRGPLAGPVAVGIAIVPKTFNKKLVKGIKDSKKLTALGREMWFAKMQVWKKEGILNFHAALVSAKEIDAKGINLAIQKGILICLKKVGAHHLTCSVLLDGGLNAPEHFKTQKTIIKGDEKEPLISLASIAAKVTRDKYMHTLAKKYPQYGFEVHKGYGTESHRKAIKKHGISSVHRKSFLKSFISAK